MSVTSKSNITNIVSMIHLLADDEINGYPYAKFWFLVLESSFHSIRRILSFFASMLNVSPQPINRVACDRAKDTHKRAG